MSLSVVGATLLTLALVGKVIADPPQPSPPPVEQQEAKQEAKGQQGSGQPTPPKDAPKSLDDLLGVPQSEGAGASAEDAARREQEKRLEKSLDEASMSDLVQRALDGMKTASDRLSDAKDAGLGTQRVQEEVVKTLDRLLQEAQRRQSKSSSSSQSSGKRDAKQDPSEKNGQQQKQQQRKQPKPSQSSGSSDSTDDSREGSREDAVAETQELTESRIEWGRLPERVRELVLQGRRDRVSTIYERLTREYYRRLAEEASR
jgi:hypothetical protein